MNCYICGGFLLNNDKHTVGKKVFHKNCWGRLNREQQKLIQEGKTFEAFDKYDNKRIVYKNVQIL